MALGVLNNLSAIYAENNLNNTNNSLQTVLQQLSSGSRINSGADDAAGLSLVNGLGANSAALTQSETNATEGVGLLQVADGALSQVTSLLNRAVTLATEASNGTLNSTQESAANQEYQSILAEVANIGSTTTYNQEQVFDGTQIAIYTGDSSTAGASVDDLNIHTLTESSVGDTQGAMSYSQGQNSVFLDLSTATTNAAVTDSLNAAGSTTINVNYLTQGSGGTAVSSNATITVGTGTNYANTAQGLISAINNSGLGLTAAFGTASQAGTAAVSGAVGNGGQTGIIITGEGVGAGTNAGEIGSMTVNAAADTLSGTLNIVGSNGATHAITLGTTGSTDTIANLANTINAAGYGLTASTSSSTLTFTSANAAVSVSGSGIQDQGASASSNVTWASATPTIGAAGSIGTLTLNSSSDVLTAGTFDVSGLNGTGTSFAMGGTGTGAIDSITQLAAAINTYSSANSGFGVTASVNAAGTVMTLAQAAGGTQNAVAGVATAALAPVNVGVIPTWTNGAEYGTKGTAGAMGTLAVTNASSTLSGTLSLTGDVNTTAVNLTLGTSGTTDTMADLYNYLTTNATEVSAMTTAGLSVSLSADQKTLTVNQSGASGNNSAKTLSTPQAATLGTVTVNNSSDTLSGTLLLTGTSGTQQSITLGTSGTTDNMADLYTYLTTGAEGTTLSGLGLAFAVNTGNTVLTVSQTASGTQNGSLSATSLAAGNASNVFTGANVASVSMAKSDARSGTTAGASLGTLSIGTGGASTDTFSAGAIYVTGANGGTTTFSTSTAGQNTLAGLATAINNAKLGVNATAPAEPR